MHCPCLLGHKVRHLRPRLFLNVLAETLAVGGLLDAASTDAVALVRTTVPYLPVGVLLTDKGASRTSDLGLWVPLRSQSTDPDRWGRP